MAAHAPLRSDSSRAAVEHVEHADDGGEGKDRGT
jgi:hypothetical protein